MCIKLQQEVLVYW